jgi:geranylgeranyl diphosphate synthase type I
MVDLRSEMKRIKELVDAEIRRIKAGIEGPDDLVEASFHLVLSGGKRVRPFILIKSAEVFGASLEDSMPAAVAIELLHNFTLIHDDIMDRDEYRRGVKTTHILFGEPVAIIAGDFLFSYVFYVLSRSYPPETGLKLVELYANASNLICMGQTMDVLPDKYIVSPDQYLEMVYRKTGALIEASAVGGGVVGGASEEELGLLREFGSKIGIAFQIADDILGIVGDPKVTGKPVGNDIRNGKKTILVLSALERMDSGSRERFLKVFGNPGSGDDEVMEAIDLIVSTGAIEDSREFMKRLYNDAIDALRNLPESEARSYLMEMARFIIYRDK